MDVDRPIVERNRYFTGKFLTARDFRTEQEYFLHRHRLHQRLLHGWGVACGLGVERHPDPDCADSWIVVRAGIAVDSAGRDVVLCDDEYLEVPWPAAGEGTAPPGRRVSLLVYARYAVSAIEPVPVICDDDGDPARAEPNRYREGATIELRDLSGLPRGCWRAPPGSHPGQDPGDLDDDCAGPEPAGGCPDPDGPCGDRVPLAVVSFDPGNRAEGYRIDQRWRPRLPVPGAALTRVVGVNWEHGALVTLDELRRRDGELRVTFDRRLQAADGLRTGISEATFVVQYAGSQNALEFLASDRDRPPRLDDDGRTAVFTIDPVHLKPRDKRAIDNTTVYIALRCDFILDCHGRPVDGDFLGAELPSGDGVPGGLFESWFPVDQ